MRRSKKWIAVGLVMLMAAAGFPGCKKGGGKLPPAPTGALNNESYMDDAAVTVNGDSVSYREAMLYLQTARQEYEGAYGSEIWQYTLNADGSSLGECALDGGRVVGLLLTAAVEGITRKKVNPNVEGYIHSVGMLLLLALMAVIMFKDIFFIVRG